MSLLEQACSAHGRRSLSDGGKLSHELSAGPASAGRCKSLRVDTAYAIVVKPVENISLYANYIEGLQTPVVVGSQFTNPGTVFPPVRPSRLKRA